MSIQALAVAAFIAVHLLAGGLRFLHAVPRSRWLSMAGGISVAYVFLHVFPELEEAQLELGAQWHLVPWLEHHAYLVALLGLAAFYGLERAVMRARQRRDEGDRDAGEPPAGHGVFWVHTLSFAVYNGLIGYLLVHREEQTTRGLLLYALAMGLHFLVNDYALRQHHRHTYDHVARWVLAAAILAGWALGLATRVEDAAVHALFAFLAGGIVLNVLKEELPEERQSRFTWFALGIAAYTGVALVV